ncbi:MAG: hypothetical protein AVDCRST_MAG87-3043 [uncultured Thermomicrobiales bacterium]|uniref:Uncharacterized protein n=1 Tax=uncultured Thermomicrobiales bacterium TaxID=1645740 RepID=A0A6J4VFF6_9BACT|nr:MAG: hypothetical protein AVDCRST_MAG87-3043 [uncultured Thermomicrobiales bacterium]
MDGTRDATDGPSPREEVGAFSGRKRGPLVCQATLDATQLAFIAQVCRRRDGQKQDRLTTPALADFCDLNPVGPLGNIGEVGDEGGPTGEEAIRARACTQCDFGS